MTHTFLNRRYTGDDGGFFSGSLGESLKRFCWALLTGFLATAFLFFLMHSLISKGDIEIIDAKESATLTIVRLIEDRELVIDDPTPKPPIPPAVEPLTVIEFPVSPFGEGEEIVVRNSPPPTHGEMDIRATDGNILPIVTVAPTYPRRMASRGIEGWVLLEFSVDQLGRVQNPQVLDAQPTSGFNKAAISAVSRYKYKPRVINGEATWVHGVQTRMVFELEEG